MPKGVYDRKSREENSMSEKNQAPVIETEKLFPVVLNKNYVPRGTYEVMGYDKPEVTRKDAAGRVIVVEPQEFIKGEMKPATYPGVGFEGKIWAGTYLKLPIEEAKNLIDSKVADRADAIAA